MALTDVAVRNAKPGLKVVRLKDDRGLYLEISPAGGKWWRLRYWIDSKENRLSLGTYPEISLKEARERRDDARKPIANGIDPGEDRKAKRIKTAADGETFEVITREWFAKFSTNWSEGYARDTITRFEQNLFPWIGGCPIAELTAPELLAAIRRIEARGAIESAHRVLQLAGQVFRYAVATGRAQRDISSDLKGAIPPTKERHLASLTDPKEVAHLLRAIEGYKGSYVVYCAFRLTPLVFLRPGELRQGEWSEIDLEKTEWRIPAMRMKMREKHIVPLSRQAVAILEEIRPLTGAGKYIFPSERTGARPMSGTRSTRPCVAWATLGNK